MLLSYDLAVNKGPKTTRSWWSSTYSCTPDSFHTGSSLASTAFGVPEPGSQYGSTAALAVNPL